MTTKNLSRCCIYSHLPTIRQVRVLGLKQLIIESTRITKDTSTLIDVILTNDPSHVAFSSIPPQVYKTNKNKIH